MDRIGSSLYLLLLCVANLSGIIEDVDLNNGDYFLIVLRTADYFPSLPIPMVRLSLPLLPRIN